MGWGRWLEHEAAQVVAVAIVFREAEERGVDWGGLLGQYSVDDAEAKDRCGTSWWWVRGGENRQRQGRRYRGLSAAPRERPRGFGRDDGVGGVVERAGLVRVVERTGLVRGREDGVDGVARLH